MLLRRRSRPLSTSATRLLWPALALGVLALVLGRRSRAPAPLPRLPVRRKPAPSSSRLRRLSAPPPEVEPPEVFWDAEGARHLEENDPAEIPQPSSPLVSEASQAAAGVAPGAFYDAGVQLRW